MTFTKDVKVYKKDSSGNFISMTVKRGNYFRVYDIEKYDGKVYYWMSGGYRVMASPLVVFKIVPMNLRVSFFNNYALIVSTHEGILKSGYPRKKYGTILKDVVPAKDWNLGVGYQSEKYTIINGRLQAEINVSTDQDAYNLKEFIPGSDIKVVETQSFPSGYYIATQNTVAYESPLLTASQLFKVEKNTLIEVPKNSDPTNVVNSFVMNSYIYNADSEYDDTLKYRRNYGYVSIINLKPIKDIQPIGTYYTTKELNAVYPIDIPINTAVTLYLNQNDYGIVLYKDKMYVVKLSYLSKTPLD